MRCYVVLGVVILAVSVGIFYVNHNLSTPVDLSDVKLQYWGPGKSKPDNKAIKKIKIEIPDTQLEQFEKKLNLTSTFTPPLEGVGFSYGVNSDYMNKFLNHWKNNYKWRQREAYLNTLPHFTTEIGGLKIHFIHKKPDPVQSKGKQVLPLLMIHGWPGSVREFYEIIPLLTTPRADMDFVFEVIAPSLPGYGFSQGASKPGLSPANVGVIFDELMNRLQFKEYYVQGGDWGSVIGLGMSTLFPSRVSGYHSNACIGDTTNSRYRALWAYLFPSFYVEEEMIERFMRQYVDFFFLEAGYMHIQSTKPDTIGLALSDSPAGLAGYILEKFSSWTKRSNRDLPEGGLDKINIDGVIDNIMIYWFNNAITTSMRLYSEMFSPKNYNKGIERSPVNVPTGCAQFPEDLFYFPKIVLEGTFNNLVSSNLMPIGGHFAAFELPKMLADDVWAFVQKVRKLPKKRKFQ